MADQPTLQKLVNFSGRVQGVGFRYTASRIAQRFRVTGYVQNLPDGRVRMMAQGDLREVDAFIGAVRDEMNRYINDMAVQDVSTGEQFSNFSIRH